MKNEKLENEKRKTGKKNVQSFFRRIFRGTGEGLERGLKNLVFKSP